MESIPIRDVDSVPDRLEQTTKALIIGLSPGRLGYETPHAVAEIFAHRYFRTVQEPVELMLLLTDPFIVFVSTLVHIFEDNLILSDPSRRKRYAIIFFHERFQLYVTTSYQLVDHTPPGKGHIGWHGGDAGI